MNLKNQKTYLFIAFFILKKILLILILIFFSSSKTNAIVPSLIIPQQNPVTSFGSLFPATDKAAQEKANNSNIILIKKNELQKNEITEKTQVIQRQKPQIRIELNDKVFVQKTGNQIGFSGFCKFSDIIVINGEPFKINPITNKFYAIVKLSNFEETILECEATNELGTTKTTKTLIRR
jgi:hypothetical protein